MLDLFGGFAVVKEWGRIGARGGRVAGEWHLTEALAVAALQRQAERSIPLGTSDNMDASQLVGAQMNDFASAFHIALELIGKFDSELRAIVVLSLEVSLTASAFAFVIGAPLGTALAVYRFPGRGVLVVIANTLLGLPPVVAGLAVYLLLSRSGPLGSLGLLFTPAAMMIAQTVLGTPIVIALVHRVAVGLWRSYGDSLLVSGASRFRAIRPLMRMGREGLLTAFLAAFGRAFAEVGAIIIVGGNIRGYTRTMTTTIALETSRGDLSLALALGMILLVLSMAVSAASLFFGRGLIDR